MKTTTHIKPWIVVLTVVFCFTGLTVFLAGCSEDERPAGTASDIEPFDYENTLVFQRADATELVLLPFLFCYCDEWEDSTIPEWSFHIMAGINPAGVTATDQIWRMKVVVKDVTADEAIVLPNNFIWDQPKYADLFIYDPANELSSQSVRSSGSITIHRLNCGPGGGIDFSIDAVIGSEFGSGSSITVTGKLVSPLTGPPWDQGD